MFNSTTKSYTLEDASGSLSWIVESLNPADYQTMTDVEINAWIDSLIDNAKDLDIADVEVRAESQSYPRFGYTTADKYEDAESWLADKLVEIESDYANERETVFQFIKTWIADNAPRKPRQSPQYFVLARSLWQGDTWSPVAGPLSKVEAAKVATEKAHDGRNSYGQQDLKRVINTRVVSKTEMIREYKISLDIAFESVAYVKDSEKIDWTI